MKKKKGSPSLINRNVPFYLKESWLNMRYKPLIYS